MARGAVMALAAGMLAACASGDNSLTYTADRGVSEQPFPANHRGEIVAFLHTYLNDPREVRDAGLAQPVERTVGGRLRYIACVRFNARDSDGFYAGVRERAVLFVDGRLDRMLEQTGDLCAGAVYAPFPELQAMRR